MVRSALPELPLDELDVLVIENVGNLVCPAEFRVGEDARAMVCSVTEGEDKPLKYPLMFRACELVIVNKIDLLAHLEFDLDKLLYNIDAVNPGVPDRADQRADGGGRRRAADLAGGAGDARGRAPCEMSAVESTDAVRGLVAERLAQRRDAYETWFGTHAEPLARLCHAMAERFARGGRLLAIGVSPTARSDVRHVAVEFVHPVIVGKRALPALGLVGESAPVTTEVRLAAGADDIVMAFGDDARAVGRDRRGSRAPARSRSRSRRCAPTGAGRAGGDPFIAQELVETAYHVLWELVHVFFEHRGLLQGRTRAPRHDAGAASFLYPFLAEQEHDLDAVLADVARVRGAEGATRSPNCARRRLRRRRSARSSRPRRRCARALDAGGRLMALGNGGSATDAMDVVADFAMPPAGGLAGTPALDLTADAAILTAIANDIGVEAIFARQIIAHGRAGDVLLVLSTSGSSASAVDALTQARRQGLESIALVGYDGGRIGSDALADHVIVAPSQHIPRIQEAQATVYHLLRELVEL